MNKLRRLLAALVLYDILTQHITRRTKWLARHADETFEAIGYIRDGNLASDELADEALRCLVSEMQTWQP